MNILTILQFFIMTWGLGFNLRFLVKESENYYERNAMRIAFGLAGFLVLSLLLNLIHIPLDWRIFMLLAIAGPIYGIVTGKLKLALPSIKLTKANLAFFVVLLLFSFTLFMYASGAYKYPYLEDSDPVSHALGIKWLATEKSIHGQEALSMISYIDPYPPGFDIFMSVLYQTSHDMFFTLKFFNSLIISLGIIFFYFMAKRFTGDYRKALFSTMVLTAIPCYLSHFIWAHGLVVTLFFPLIYSLEMSLENKRWWIAIVVVFAAILFVQPSQPIKLAVMAGIYILIRMISTRKIQKELWYGVIVGGIISLIWWGTKAAGMVGSLISTREEKGQIAAEASGGLFSSLQKAFPPDGGTASRVYNFNDFFYAKMQNMINNPVGVGVVLYLLLFVSLIIIYWKAYKILKGMRNPNMLLYGVHAIAGIPLILLGIRYLSLIITPVFTSLYYDLAALGLLSISLLAITIAAPARMKKMTWTTITLSWLTFTFLGINSITFSLPVGLIAFRFWMLYAIPFSLILGEAGLFLWDIRKKWGILVLLLPLILIGIFLTSGVQKHAVNTAIWGHAGAFTPYFQTDEIVTYNWLRTLPYDTKVFDITGNGEFVSARDKDMCFYCDYSKRFKEELFTMDAQEIHIILKEEGYEYLIFGANINHRMQHVINDSDEIQVLFKDITESGLFVPVHQGNAAIIFRIS